MSSSFVFILFIFVIIKYLSINVFATHDQIFDHDHIFLTNNIINNNNNSSNDNNYNNNININVYSTIDSAADISLCNGTNISTLNSNCNFRSAWELCHTLNLNIHCQINLPIKSTILMNMSYGSLILKSGMVFFQ